MQSGRTARRPCLILSSSGAARILGRAPVRRAVRGCDTARCVRWHTRATVTRMSETSSVGDVAGWEHRALERSLAPARDRSSERARRLVDAARHLASSGSTSFTVGDVAADAGVSLRSFYRHFSGRDDLLLALFEEEARLGATMLDEEVRDVTDPGERARRSVEALCELVVTGSVYADVLVREHLR